MDNVISLCEYRKQKQVQKALIDRDGAFEKVKALEGGGDGFRFENRFRCKDGSYKWISWNLSPLPDKRIFVGTGRDITERKTAEEELRNANKDLVSRLEMRTQQVSSETGLRFQASAAPARTTCCG